jgi:hypothetical protein
MPVETKAPVVARSGVHEFLFCVTHHALVGTRLNERVLASGGQA